MSKNGTVKSDYYPFQDFKKNIDYLLDMQNSLNDKQAGADWKSKLSVDDFLIAIVVEGGECFDSLAYKWWKKQEADIQNVEVELVDILHFVLSAYLLLDDVERERYIRKAYESLNDTFIDIYFYEKTIRYALLELLRSPIDEMLGKLFNLFAMIGVNFNSILTKYMVKNILNEFRSNNGYKEGTYIKEWNGDEDNVIAYSLANKLLEKGGVELVKKNLYSEIENYYKESVK